MSLNKWFGMGRITKDLEKRTTPSGVSVMDFTIAVDDDYKPKDGGEKHVSFVDCVAWRSTADFLEKYSGKGRNIVVVGSWRSEKWTDKEGNNRTSWKVQVDNVYFADSKRDGGGQSGGFKPAGAPVDVEPGGFSELAEAGSDLPF